MPLKACCQYFAAVQVACLYLIIAIPVCGEDLEY